MKNILVIFILIFCFACKNPDEKTAKGTSVKPNIVFIFTDDQASRTISSLGNHEIITPNLDRLVKTGSSFTNAYNMGAWNGAVCVASRSMMISGRTVWNAKEISEDWSRKDSISMNQTWGQLMHSGGYNTFITGKWHVNIPPKKVFDSISNIKPGMAGDNWDFKKMQGLADDIDAGNVDLDEVMPVGYNRPKNVKDTTWKPYDTTNGGYWKGGRHWNLVLKDDATSFIKSATGEEKPFFMYVASNAPHDPRQAPKEYLDMYPLDNISLPENWLPEYPFKNAIKNGPSLRDEALAPYPRTSYAIKTHIREYYASITYLDKQIGDILDALEESGEMKNTYIFFTSDHGLSLGEHGLLGKQSLFESSMKAPLIIVGPHIPKNKKVDTPVYVQDVMPSTLEAASIEKPEYVDFKSLISLAQGTKNVEHYDAIYGAYLDVERSIRKGNLKLILYPEISKGLLFDLEKDPNEMNNLFDNSDYQNKVKSAFISLVKLQDSLNDPLDLREYYPELSKNANL
ncbi:Arylsulfatase A [Salegentibacter agarivorans]|uniref:Arylsulfatase A n=1 Tax=Salegentibacter agarivorans TaxID=345907 RepID=A0A1I2KMW4_9FLAO|nr:sulfatase-like hydrolase/transferase [Salegentibacter agarivorans]SFF67669.1 Arylsulfatase A [Salegentibacter agarivorans]